MALDILKNDTFANVLIRGKVLKIVREQYLRDDISCHSPLCSLHSQVLEGERVGVLPIESTHYVVPFYDVVQRYLEVLEIPELCGIIFLQSQVSRLLHESGKRNYNHIMNIVRDKRRSCTLFLNEFHKDTHLPRTEESSLLDWLNQCTYKAAAWYIKHLDHQTQLVLVTENPLVIEKYKDETPGVFVISFVTYLRNFWPDLTSAIDLYESIRSLHEDPGEVTIEDKGKLFPAHWNQDQLAVGLKNGRLLQGRISVSKHSETAHLITSSRKGVSLERDVLLPNGKLRNRAVHGDDVAVELLPESQWKKYQKHDDQRVGQVVGIIQRQWRDYMATFPEDVQDGGGKGGRYVLVTPYDRRIPRIRLRTTRAKELANQRVIVRLDKWEWDSQYPQGHFVKAIGLAGSLETEVASLLVEHSISVLPFSSGLLSELPNGESWQVDDEEVMTRKDLRKSHLVFSIDPKGCEDVDDVLSVRKLENGRMELGVHIADVCYFVKPSSLTDLEARDRATSVYLSDRRFDMLPSVLSTHLCSLRSLQDRYAVSVRWEMNANTGEVLRVWFGRTIINSSYQLCYETAQAILDGDSLEQVLDTIPELQSLPEDLQYDRFEVLKESLEQLRHLSRCLQSFRYQEGVLQLDSLEVQFEFELDSAEGQQLKAPKPKQHLEVHETVAECMIAANHWVAKKIKESFPQHALLRLHPHPNEGNLEELCRVASSQGLHISTSSNQDLAKSLDCAVNASDPNVNMILRLLGTRAMNEAQYVSTGSHPDFYHYGLGLDAYTHFTSPIRRYADVLVHRLLLASCSLDQDKSVEPVQGLLANQELEDLCHHLNSKHRAAQQVQKASAELFQALYFQRLHAADPARLCEAVVYGFHANGVLALVPQYGLKGAVKLIDSKGPVLYIDGDDNLEWLPGQLIIDQEKSRLSVLPSQGEAQVYHLFDHIEVKIQVMKSHAHALRLSFELVRKLESIPSSKTKAANANQQPEKKLQELVKAVKMEDESEGIAVVDQCPSAQKEGLYHLLQNLREIALSENAC